MRLVYGGGRVGLMGIAADAAIAAGGNVIGIIPRFLERREVGNFQVTELIETDSMHARKLRMFEESDGFVALPGGLGTLDETFEVITWRQLGLHDKPIVVADIEGYWRPLADLIDSIIGHGFAKPEVRRLFSTVDSVAAILPALIAERPPAVAPHAERL